ncbi:PREDICTED: TMV resistance N, partial [Prunus dulcis]
MIESIPANIEQASWLFCLSLINCKSLQSLPELPLKLYSLKAHVCTPLNTVSRPRTALNTW